MLIDRARREYERVLRFAPNSCERVYGQAYMCFLRDYIAEFERRDPEIVQAEYEKQAWEDIFRSIRLA